MTLKEFIKYTVEDDFSYLVIEACNDQFYGFNLRNKEEKNQAKNIVRDSDWYVVGWKVSRELPSWVKKQNNGRMKLSKKILLNKTMIVKLLMIKSMMKERTTIMMNKTMILMMTKMMMKRRPELKTTLLNMVMIALLSKIHMSMTRGIIVREI